MSEVENVVVDVWVEYEEGADATAISAGKHQVSAPLLARGYEDQDEVPWEDNIPTKVLYYEALLSTRRFVKIVQFDDVKAEKEWISQQDFNFYVEEESDE